MRAEGLKNRDMDVLVAEKVLRVNSEAAKNIAETWWPSESISDAFEVVEAMRERGLHVAIYISPDDLYHVCTDFSANFSCEDRVKNRLLTRAICMAALRACDE